MIQPCELVSVWERMQKMDKPIVLYGMGNGADKILDVCGDHNIPVAGVFASDEFCRDQTFRGYMVTNYAQAKKKFGQMIVLVAFGTSRPEVIRNIGRIAEEQELYAPDVPLMGDELFDPDYFLANRVCLEKAFSCLADEQSRKTFLCSIDFKISGKLSYLRECETPADEAFRILDLGDREVYIDGGAYTGDTVLEFVQKTGGYEKIIAVEPDGRNYRKLIATAGGLKNVECHQYKYRNTPTSVLCFPSPQTSRFRP